MDGRKEGQMGGRKEGWMDGWDGPHMCRTKCGALWELKVCNRSEGGGGELLVQVNLIAVTGAEDRDLGGSGSSPDASAC